MKSYPSPNGIFCNSHGPALNENATGEKLEVNLANLAYKEIPYQNMPSMFILINSQD